MNLQPTLQDETIILTPLQASEFEALYAVANDPLIWEQHPNPDRWKREAFQTYFDGAMASGGAFIIRANPGGEVLGCTRFYDHDADASELKIGYTFFARRCWGTGVNHSVKRLMLSYALQHVNQVIFHVGAQNKRSRIAMERLGAELLGEQEVAYYGEAPRINVVYRIKASDFFAQHPH